MVRGSSGERYAGAWPRDWLRARTDTASRHLFAALTDMERSGATERTLSRQEFALMRDALTEPSPASLPLVP